MKKKYCDYCKKRTDYLIYNNGGFFCTVCNKLLEEGKKEYDRVTKRSKQ